MRSGSYAMEQNPTWASSLGDRRWNDRWPDMSLEAIGKREDARATRSQRLGKIDRAKLSPADQLNYDLFKKDTRSRHRGLQVPHVSAADQSARRHPDRGRTRRAAPLRDVKDYEDWIARLRAFPTLMDQTIALMREGAKAKIMWPRIVHRPRPGADRQADRARPGGEPVLQAVQRSSRTRSRARTASGWRKPRARRSTRRSSRRSRSSRSSSSTSICRRASRRSASGRCRKAASSTPSSRGVTPRPT